MSDDRLAKYAEAIRAVPGVPADAWFTGEFLDADGNRVGYIGDGGIFDDYAAAAMAVADEEQAETRERLDAKIAMLRQGLWDTWAALGHDTDGDTGPGALIAGMGDHAFVRMVVYDATAWRRESERDYDTDISALEAKVATLESQIAFDASMADRAEATAAALERVWAALVCPDLVDTTVATGREANADVVLSYLSRLRSMTDSPRLLADIAEVEAERIRELAQRSGTD